MAENQTLTPEERARKRAKSFSDLVWHAGTYVIINAFLWTLDIVTGNGLEWAYWTTIPWGIGLAFHALAHYVDGRNLEERAYRKHLEAERRRDQRPD